jgi:hypothetical protein
MWSRGEEGKAVRWQPNPHCEPSGQHSRSSWMTGATPSLNRSWTNEGIEKQLSTASEHSPSTGSDVGSSVECRRGNDGDGEESSPEDSETP